ncbi:hypothetical protein [Streptomyces decoyicus]
MKALFGKPTREHKQLVGRHTFDAAERPLQKDVELTVRTWELNTMGYLVTCGNDRWKILAEVENAANELAENANAFVQDASAHLNGRRLRPSLHWRVGRILRRRESMDRSEFSPRLNLGQGCPWVFPTG